MKYLEKFDFFYFGKNKKKDWKDKFNDIYNFYLKNKNNKVSILDKPQINISDDSFWVARGKENLAFYGKNNKGNHNLELVDFTEADIYDYQSKEGVYSITEEEYNQYFKKVQEMSDWLDTLSDNEFKSDKSVSKTGYLNLDNIEQDPDLALIEKSDSLKSELKIINKEFEFELSYHIWTSLSTNELVVERRKLKITNLKVGFGGRFWCELFTIDPFNQKASIWLESDSSCEYYDLEENKWPYDSDKLIRMSSVKKEVTRKEERDYYKNIKYPYAFSYHITPSKYDTIEMVNNITKILEQMNSEIKKR